MYRRRAEEPMEMIHAEKLIYEYDKRDEDGNVVGTNRAIDGVDIDIPQGSFVAVLGHNGSGKSTLAKHMNAILVPTGGTMWVDGRDTKDPAELWNVRQTAGMVFQNPDNQIIGTVVEEDVGFGPENLGVPTEKIWERIAGALEATGMTACRGCFCSNYSISLLFCQWPARLAIGNVFGVTEQRKETVASTVRMADSA